MPKTSTAPAIRFWAKVDKTESCWLWTGALTYGYGRFRLSKTPSVNIGAHRFAYQEAHGPVPDGLHLDHLCRNRACVNPAHLEPVTSAVNVLRGEGVTAENARKTQCVNGHDLSPRPGTTWRRCYTCRKEHDRRYREGLRRRAA